MEDNIVLVAREQYVEMRVDLLCTRVLHTA